GAPGVHGRREHDGREGQRAAPGGEVGPLRAADAAAARPHDPRGRGEAMTTPQVSVLMPVYNVAPWVGEAVASILAQTLTDLELLVIDDASTDATPQLLAAVRDERLRV